MRCHNLGDCGNGNGHDSNMTNITHGRADPSVPQLFAGELVQAGNQTIQDATAWQMPVHYEWALHRQSD